MRKLFGLLLISAVLYAQENVTYFDWILNSTDSIGGFSVSALTDLPILTQSGESLIFDGIDDALFMQNNPLGDAESFTIEIMLRPDSSANAANFEQRYLHIRRQENDDRRILMELRLTTDQMWYLDTYIRSEINNRTLVNEKLLHPSGEWYHIALVYDKGIMRHYVNGVEEASGEVTYVPIGDGQTSMGARQNPKSWFKGAINRIKFTRQALLPHEFFFLPSNIKENTGSVNRFFLFQNYPNPFNPLTHFVFRILDFGLVQLKVFDFPGNEVATVINRELSPGIYEIPFNANGLSSGIYFCMLESSSYVQIRKILLLK